jgi:hypothetical protein
MIRLVPLLLAILPLTAQTPSGGDWQVLFDGSGVEHWRGMRGAPFPEDFWTIEDGALTTRPALVGRDIITKDEYANFELTFEWKISEGGNSGVKYLVDEEAPSPYRGEMMGLLAVWLAVCVGVLSLLRRQQRFLAPVAALLVLTSLFAVGRINDYLKYSSTALEMQILDNARHPNGHDPLKRAGSLYGLIAATPDAAKPAGEWNSARILVDGDRVEHELNGQVVVSYQLGSPRMESLISDSHFSDIPAFGTKKGRRIVLQHHQDRVWFRIIRIRHL